MEEVAVVIVGAGPAGIAISACLNTASIPNIVLEREDCCGSLWKKRTYDRLKLHLGKPFCTLPFLSHSSSTPLFMSKSDFIRYLDDYTKAFKVKPHYLRSVGSAWFDVGEEKWRVEAENRVSRETETYTAEFLVVATGENGEGYIPALPGLENFTGEILHSSEYKCGSNYEGEEVLVVGSGNSGMEIAYDLSNFGAKTSIVIRSPTHVVSKFMIYAGMLSLKYLRPVFVDAVITFLSRLVYGNLSRLGIQKPEKGPFVTKSVLGRSPVIDVGTIKKIRQGEIKVLPAITNIEGNNVVFKDGTEREFKAMVFATGYKDSTSKWLKDVANALGSDGKPRDRSTPWKGKNGLYFAGLTKMGLPGVSKDAIAISQDIHKVIRERDKETLANGYYCGSCFHLPEIEDRSCTDPDCAQIVPETRLIVPRSIALWTISVSDPSIGGSHSLAVGEDVERRKLKRVSQIYFSDLAEDDEDRQCLNLDQEQTRGKNLHFVASSLYLKTL